jgi:hypothetical protein
MFAHGWVKGGFDSDDDQELIAHKQGRTLGGAAAEIDFRTQTGATPRAPGDEARGGQIEGIRGEGTSTPEEKEAGIRGRRAREGESRARKGEARGAVPAFAGKGRKLRDQPPKSPFAGKEAQGGTAAGPAAIAGEAPRSNIREL